MEREAQNTECTEFAAALSSLLIPLFLLFLLLTLSVHHRALTPNDIASQGEIEVPAAGRLMHPEGMVLVSERTICPLVVVYQVETASSPLPMDACDEYCQWKHGSGEGRP